jgi:hypothetical protein
MLMGVLACEFKTFFDVHFNTAISDPRCMSRRLLRAIFTALFSKAARITAEVAVDNRRALKNVLRMGFVLEGYCRLGIEGTRDAYVFGMLKEDCVFLPHARPASPRSHIPDSVVRNIEAFGQSGGRVGRLPDLDDLVPRELAVRDSAASSGDQLITHVFETRRPANMPLVDARTARAQRRMGCLLAGWLGAMSAFAHPPVDPVHFRATAAMAAADHTVTKLIFGERPKDAFVGFGGKGLFEKALSSTVTSHALILNPNRNGYHGKFTETARPV